MRDLALLLFVALATPLLAAQADTARLEGCVLDPMSRPVANARVAVELDGGEIAHTQTDASGTFVLGKLPARDVVVRATTAAPDVGAAVVDLAERGGAFALVRTMPARRIAGTVRDETGKAVAGAWVACVPTGAAEFAAVGARAISDAEGRFVLPHVPFGRIAVRAWSAGLAGFAADVNGTADATVDCVLPHDDVQELTFELAGANAQQRAEAQPRISVKAEEARLLLPTAVRCPPIGDDNRFRVRGWPCDDAVHVTVVLSSACVDPPKFDLPPDASSRTKRFTLEPTEPVRGRIVGKDVAAGGRVLLASGYSFDGLRTSATTLPDGTFSMLAPVPRGDAFRLRCDDPSVALVVPSGHRADAFRHADAFAASVSVGDVVVKHRRDAVHEFELVRAHAVRCTLRDASGLPLAGAEVALVSPERTQWTHVVGRGTVPVEMARRVHARGRSRVDGTFAAEGLPLRDGEGVVIQVVGPRGMLETSFAIGAAAAQDLGELTVGPTASLAGIALDADGKPVAGARLVVHNLAGVAHLHGIGAGRDGRFRLDGLVPGPCVVWFAGEDRQARSFTVTKEQLTEVTLQLPPAVAAARR